MGSKGKSRWSPRAWVKKEERQRRRNEAKAEEQEWKMMELLELHKSWTQEKNQRIADNADGMTDKDRYYEQLERQQNLKRKEKLA
tara:strand:+ start:59 stop:313 length:255 start_codon:yes stop_codon:yes gene_type:complete